MLTNFFEQLLSMAVTALPVMAVVLAARWLLRGVPKKYTYLLWLVVAFRLVCPVSIESPVGFIRAGETAQQIDSAEEIYIEPTLTYRDNGGFTPDYDVLLDRGYIPNEQGEIVTNEAGTREALQVKDLLVAAAMVWLLGMAVMLGYLVFTTLRLRRQTALAVRMEDNVWECDGIPTPFVLGWLRPRIYIPFRMTESERTYILAHERYHISRFDHWAKLAGLLILTVYWWNPAVWLCWVLFCRDMEMRCDEAVLAALGDGVKRDYSLSLISFALDRHAPMALAFGEHDAAKRVKNVLRWKRAKPMVVFLAVAAVAIVAVVCGTNAGGVKESRVVVRPAQDGGVSIQVQAGEEVNSWALFRDIYHEGRLIDSGPMVLDGFEEEGTGVSTRDFHARLWTELENDPAGGFGGKLAWSFESFGIGSFDDTLPKEHYTGAAMVVGEGEEKTVYRPEKNSDMVLCTILLSTDPEGKNTLYHRDESLTQVNDTVVQFRLIFSTEPMDAFTVNDFAAALYSLRAETVQDTERVQALVDALGMGDWGSYTVGRWIDGEETYLRLDYTALTVEESVVLTESWQKVQLLTALIGDIVGVRFTLPRWGENQPVDAVVKEKEEFLDEAVRKATGHENLKAMGRTPQGVRMLLEYLEWNTTTAAVEAERLFELARKQDPWEFTGVLIGANLWGSAAAPDYAVGWPGNFGPLITFPEAPKDAQSLDAAMARRAVVLMRLFPEEVGYVMWTYPDENGDMVRRELHESEAGAMLALSSSLIAIQPPESADDLKHLLHFLGALTDKAVTVWAGEGNTFSPEKDAEAAAVWFAPEDVHDIEYAALKGPKEDQRWYPLTGNDYEYLLSHLSSAVEIPETNCAFSGLLYLHRADGVTGKIQAAVDDCGVFRSGGKYYRFDTGNDRFYKAFGVTTEHMLSGTALNTALPDTVLEVDESFADLMGFSGYIDTEKGAGDWYLRSYYTIQGGGPRKIAETFGYGTPQEFAVDLDGDGVKELVANVQFGADGVRRAYVYQRRGNDVYLGVPTAEGLPGFDDWGAGAFTSEYDPVDGVFRIRYAQKNSTEYGVLETRNTDRLVWGKYTARGTEDAYLNATE